MSLSEATGQWKTGRIKKAYRSVFTKLVLVIVATGLVMNLIVFVFHSLGVFWHVRIPLSKNVTHYAHLLVEELGSPPSLEKAREISKQNFMDIGYESPEISWATAENIAQSKNGHGSIVYKDEDTMILHSRRRGAIVITRGEEIFTFTANRKLFSEIDRSRRHGVLALSLTVCLFLAFLIIRRLLEPLRWFETGIREVGEGSLEYKIPQTRQDEFGNLARAFNRMTEKISDMLKAREQLLIDVSHELRTPVTRMKVATEFLDNGQAKESIREDLLEMETMITEILERARLKNMRGDIKKETFSLNDLIREAASPYLAQRPGLDVIDPGEQIHIHTDRNLLRTVLTNIMTNAIKYSPDDGPRVTIETQEDSGHVTIRISDRGEGIPQDELDRVLEPFYRTDKSRFKGTGGFGLGLSICKNIMDALDGSIEIHSEQGKGTRVSLRLPARTT